MQRPLGITVTAVLMVANVVLDVGLALTSPHVPAATISPDGFSTAMILVHVLIGALILVELFAIPFYWFGKSWARWAVLVGCLFYIVTLRKLPANWHRSHEIAYLDIAAGVLAFYLIWYLHTEHVRIWFAQSGNKRNAELTGR